MIKEVRAREILDSRGNPTVEVDVETDSGIYRSGVPSGASTGIHEALELRDGNKKRYNGKGVLKAVANVNKIIGPAIKGMNEIKQEDIDEKMIALDGTENKSKLGANAILGVSMAVCRAGAAAEEMPLYAYIAEMAGVSKFVLPVPFFNIINGGKHADNELKFQEFMIAPVGAKSFSEGLRMGSDAFRALKEEIHKHFGRGTTTVGDEGGFAPEQFDKVNEPLDFISTAIKKAGCKGKMKIAMDVAASEFFDNGKYSVDGKELDAAEMVRMYNGLAKKYDIISIEDPFSQDDFESFSHITGLLGSKIQIVGDDLLVTNPKRIGEAVQSKSCNALLLKVNQIGTVTEAMDACRMAKMAGWGVMVSHRSGETTDDFIADLAVGIKAGQIKAGAPCRGERLAKYNRLLRIEEELGKSGKYAGKDFRKV